MLEREVVRPPVAPHFSSIAEASAARSGPRDGTAYLYARFGSTSSRHAEGAAARALDAEWAIVTSSGTSALDTAIGALFLSLPPERRTVAVTEGIYIGSRHYFDLVLAGLRRIEVIRAPRPDGGDGTAAFTAMLRDVRPGLVFTESVTNPFLAVADIGAMASRCRAHGAALAVDATLAPPPNLSPLRAGADLVLYSATKYLSGRNDILAGVVAGGSETLLEQGMRYRRWVGCNLDDASCDALAREIADVEPRVVRQISNAALVARLLSGRPGVARVWTCRESAVVTFELSDASGPGAQRACEAVVTAVQPEIPFSASFGSTRSTVAFLGTMDPGYTDRPILRLSCGTEPPDLLLAVLTRALEAPR